MHFFQGLTFNSCVNEPFIPQNIYLPCLVDTRNLHVLHNVVFLALLGSKVATCRDRPL